jgi:hypothetical protein
MKYRMKVIKMDKLQVKMKVLDKMDKLQVKMKVLIVIKMRIMNIKVNKSLNKDQVILNKINFKAKMTKIHKNNKSINKVYKMRQDLLK